MTAPFFLELQRALEPGERIVWADHAHRGPLRRRPRTPLGLAVLAAALAAIGGAAALAVAPVTSGLLTALAGVGAVVVVVALGLLAQHRADRSAPHYAITDRGRAFVELERTSPGSRDAGGAARARLALLTVPHLPPEVLIVDDDGEEGSIDLGEVEVSISPGGRHERRSVRLADVAYPAAVVEVVRGVASAR